MGNKSEALMRLEVPIGAEFVGHARRAVQSVTSRLNMTPEQSGDVLLAVGEACNNAVLYGSHAERAHLDVSCWLIHSNNHPYEQALEIDVKNTGNGFHPEARSSEFSMPSASDLANHGRGLPLMRLLMDDVQFLSVEGDTVVRMTKRLGWD